MAMQTEVKRVVVPDIGDFADVEIIEIFVAANQTVKKEEPLISLESEKATMDIPVPFSGTVKELSVKLGDKLSEGDLILMMETESGIASDTVSDPSKTKETQVAQTDSVSQPAQQSAQIVQSSVQQDTQSGVLDIPVPDIGDFKDVEIIEVLVSAGDAVEVEAPLITLESEKATMEIPSPYPGVVKELKVKLGDKLSEGDLILTLEASAETMQKAASRGKTSVGQLAETTQPTEMPTETPVEKSVEKIAEKSVDQNFSGTESNNQNTDGQTTGNLAHASPAIRRFARELGVTIEQVSGTGRKGRITKEDVKQFVKQAMSGGVPAAASSAGTVGGSGIPAIPLPDFSQFGEIEEQSLSRIKKLSGKHLHASWLNIPHVTQFDEADINELEAFRKSAQADAVAEGVKLTPLVFILKATVATLKAFPQFNASLDLTDVANEKLIVKRYYNIGVAVDTPDGLVVPVVKNADQKSIYQLAAELMDLSSRAREGKLKMEEMQGGSFTISSLGGIGGTNFTPIVNAPEVAILGVARAQMKPIWDAEKGEFAPKLMLPLALSYDHRVIDGADGARFVTHLSQNLQEFFKVLLQ